MKNAASLWDLVMAERLGSGNGEGKDTELPSAYGFGGTGMCIDSQAE